MPTVSSTAQAPSIVIIPFISSAYFRELLSDNGPFIVPWCPKELKSLQLKSGVQEVRQPNAGLLQLKLDHRVCLPLVGGRDRCGILIGQGPVQTALSKPPSKPWPSFGSHATLRASEQHLRFAG